MKNVTYKTQASLGCECGSEVLICVSNSLTGGAPYIRATQQYIKAECDACGDKIFTYYLQYDEQQLTDPTYYLTVADISGIICGGCIESYVAWAIDEEILPAGNAAFQALVAFDVGTLAGDTSVHTLDAATRWVNIDNQSNGDVYVSMDGGTLWAFHIKGGKEKTIDLGSLRLVTAANIWMKAGVDTPNIGYVMISAIK